MIRVAQSSLFNALPIFSCLLLASSLLAADGGVVDIASRRELFVDHYLIDQLKSAELRLHRPIDEGKVLAFDQPWEGPFCAYATVIQTPDKYQLYYRGLRHANKDTDAGQVTCYAESIDGITWQKPTLKLFAHEEAKTNNIILNAAPVTHNFSPFLDARPKVDASQRYKGLGGYVPKGLMAYVSADGIHWSTLQEGPVLPPEQARTAEMGDSLVFDSQNVSFYSAGEGKYLCYYRVYLNRVRRIARVESDDFVHWTKPTLMEYRRADADAPIEQLYTNQTQPYFRASHIYLATAARFMLGRQVLTTQQAKAIGVNPKYFHDTSDAVLLSTRGGNIYQRTFMGAFIAPGIGAENWVSRTNYPALNIVQTGPAEMSLYVNQNYGQPTAHLRRYSMRLDGFASLHADYDGGQMLSKPLRFAGAKLFLNFATSAAGSVRVEICDAEGAALPGFALDDCQEIIGNEIERAVAWSGGDLSKLASTTVRLRFVLKDADVYSLRFGDE